jgi:DNA polymerase III epsilon subunit-like protein
MFTPLGLFKAIPCPQGSDCTLLTCVFSHQETSPGHSGSTTAKQIPVPNTDRDGPLQAPEAKKRKIALDVDSGVEQVKPPFNSIPNKEKDGEHIRHHDTSGERPSNDQKPYREASSLQSITRTVSPPARTRPSTKGSSTAVSSQVSTAASDQSKPPPRQAKKEALNPRMLTKPPAPHSVRTTILTKLHAAMSALNDKMKRLKDDSKSSLILSADELIIMALDEEEKAARESPKLYGNVIKLRIVKLQKMAIEDWEKEVITHLNVRYYKIEPKQTSQKPQKLITDLNTKEEIAMAAKLTTDLKGKEQFGYVTEVPSQEEIESAKKGIEAAQGWEKCDRCAGRFQVFPGRREDGTLATGGHCTYHPGKLLRPPKKATDHITGHSDAYFPCCNETVGTSAGCTKAEYHVFKISEVKRLAAVLQFEETPSQPGAGPQKPVCFDCEMAYTTLGLELIRLTAVSWPEGDTLLDVLVKPMGEVLDLNSKFSGVWPEHYAKAVPYGTSVPDTTSEDGEVGNAPMEVVDSPAAARALLFKLLQPDTPLIGHAIDNDLNACRIIHPTIIDTVLLYPHPRGLPLRYSLKHLSKKYLDRDIQTGGDKGHDSKEDAIATGDLVRVKAAEKWKVLKRQGWTIEGDKLVAPAGQAVSPGHPVGLGQGAGQKRKNALGETGDSPGR